MWLKYFRVCNKHIMSKGYVNSVIWRIFVLETVIWTLFYSHNERPEKCLKSSRNFKNVPNFAKVRRLILTHTIQYHYTHFLCENRSSPLRKKVCIFSLNSSFSAKKLYLNNLHVSQCIDIRQIYLVIIT